MSDVLIYTKTHCPYCTKAKALFNKKSISYREVDISDNEAARNEMISKSGGRMTVPQIFIDGKSIGGCDDLYRLYESGELKL